MSQSSSKGPKTTSIAPSKTTFSALPDAAIFEILSKTDNPKELIKACAINKQYAEYCVKHKEQINKAQMLHKYPMIEKMIENPYTFLNMMLYRKFDLNKLISLGVPQYMKLYGFSKNLSWENNFENLGILITMFGADPKDALEHMIKYRKEYNLTVEQFKQLFKFIKNIQPYFKLEESILATIIPETRNENDTRDIEIIKLLLPEYKSLSAITIGKAFLTPALEDDLDLLWSFLIKLDPKTIDEFIDEEDKETLLEILLDKHFSIPESALGTRTPEQIRAQRKERFLLHLLSQNPNVNIKVNDYWTSAHNVFTEEVSPTLTDTVLLEILKRADLTIKAEEGWTHAHIAFNNKNLSERVLLALLKRKPDLNLQDEKNQFTPAYLAFINENITENVLLEILNQDINFDLINKDGGSLLKVAFYNPYNTMTEKVLLKLVDIAGKHIYDKHGKNHDPMIFALLNKNTPDTVLLKILQNYPNKLSTVYKIQEGTKTVSKTVEKIIKDAGKEYLLNEIRPVKSIRTMLFGKLSSSKKPGPSSSAQPSSSTQPAPSKRSSKSSSGGKRRTKSKK